MYITDVAPIFKNNKNLKDYLYDLTFQIDSLNEVSFLEKNKIVFLILDAKKEEQSYVLFDTDNVEKNCEYFKNFLKTGSKDFLLNFAENLVISAYEKYKDTIEAMFCDFLEKRIAA